MNGDEIRELCLSLTAARMSTFPGAARSASHVGRYGWVELDFAAIPDEILRETIEAAWARTAPKKLAAERRAAP